jgi:hypothetical protein
VLYWYSTNSEETTLQPAGLAMALVSAINTELPQEEAKKKINDLMAAAENQPVSLQKLVIGNVKYSATVLPKVKMAIFQVLPTVDPWP